MKHSLAKNMLTTIFFIVLFTSLSIGVSTITNGTVRVLTTPVLSNIQISKVNIDNN